MLLLYFPVQRVAVSTCFFQFVQLNIRSKSDGESLRPWWQPPSMKPYIAGLDVHACNWSKGTTIDRAALRKWTNWTLLPTSPLIEKEKTQKRYRFERKGQRKHLLHHSTVWENNEHLHLQLDSHPSSRPCHYQGQEFSLELGSAWIRSSAPVHRLL